jgi:hypothetical protein
MVNGMKVFSRVPQLKLPEIRGKPNFDAEGDGRNDNRTRDAPFQS